MTRVILLFLVVTLTSPIEGFVTVLGKRTQSLHEPRYTPSNPFSRLSHQATTARELEDADEIDPNLTSAKEPIPKKLVLWRVGVARKAIPISVALTIGTFSLLEIVESIRELAEYKVGHAHGISILALLRLGRSVTFFQLLRATRNTVRLKSKAVVHVVKGVGALQTQTEELEEYVGELEHEIRRHRFQGETTQQNDTVLEKRSMRSALTNFITSPGIAITAATLAVVACIAEIVDDMKPGAHHGAALLALSEMYYQFRRLKARIKKDQNRTSRWRTSTWMGKFWSTMPVGPAIAIAAALYAGIEVVEDMSPGAHHGVAILAMAELVENINRSRLIQQFENKLNGGAFA